MVYTKTGDKGETSLVGGTRVLKCDPRVEAYGTVDELNSQVGVVAELARSISQEQYEVLKDIQNKLFVIQTLLATEDADIYTRLPQLPADAEKVLEREIDALNERLPKNNAFIIPGGNLAGAQCHVARTVCRRAERLIVSLAQTIEIDDVLRRYINRLSDYLFVLSRILVVDDGKQEHFWKA